MCGLQRLRPPPRRPVAPGRTAEWSQVDGSGSEDRRVRPGPGTCPRAGRDSPAHRRRGSRSSAHTCSADGSEKLPAKTASRRSRICSSSRQQRVAPFERGPQRRVPGDLATPTEQGERLAQPLGDLGRLEVRDASGGKLQGERNAVEATADLHDGRRVAGVEDEAGPDVVGPVEKEPYGGQASRGGPGRWRPQARAARATAPGRSPRPARAAARGSSRAR